MSNFEAIAIRNGVAVERVSGGSSFRNCYWVAADMAVSSPWGTEEIRMVERDASGMAFDRGRVAVSR